jgi:glycosyltransferase involved in cell wall biosynthesis
MKISVLIPAYLAAPYIQAALNCLPRQTHMNWEVIVVEDGSNDGTEALVKQFAVSVPQPVTYLNLGRNQGVSAARNKLLDLAQGGAVAFLDADDAWDPTHLANAVAKITEGGDLVVSGIKTFELETNRPLLTLPAPVSLVREPVLTLFQRSAIISSSAVVLTKELADRAGRFDLTLRIGEDRDYWLRCALAGGRFKTTDGFTCNYAKHAASSMARTRIVAEQNIQFYEKYRGLKNVPGRLRRRMLADSLMTLGRLLRGNAPQESAACFWRAWSCEPLNLRIPIHLAFTGWRSMAAALAT